MYDVIIIGAGPGGLTAATYAARSRLRTLVLESADAGGQLLEAHLVENYPGFPEGIEGPKLAELMRKQAERHGAEVKSREEVIDLDLKGKEKEVITASGRYKAKAVIIATGAKPIKLSKRIKVKGESELLGKGVSYCATCDGPFFQGKPVVVVGGDDRALKEAVYLSTLASSVKLISLGELRTDRALAEKAKKHGIEMTTGRGIKEIVGKERVEGVVVIGDSGEELIKCDGVFIATGREPQADLFRRTGMKIDQRGFIPVGEGQKTNLPGVFAAGDVVLGSFKQISVTVGQGATAAFNALKYVRSL